MNATEDIPADAEDGCSAPCKFTLPDHALLPFKNWGPVVTPKSIATSFGHMESYPFEISSKPDRAGRVCVFTFYNSQRTQQRDGRAAGAAPEEGTEFQLVDSRPLKLNRYQMRRKIIPRRNVMQQQQQAKQHQHHPQHQLNPSQQQPRNATIQNKLYQQQQQRRQQLWQMTNRLRQLAEWSIEPKHNWEAIETVELQALSKLKVDSSKISVDDVEFFGTLRTYNKSFDRTMPKMRKMLETHHIQEKTYYWPSTSEDPFLLAQSQTNQDINVFVTDQILACLMAAVQSRISWHVMIQKTKNRLILDKQSGTSIDLMTVNETSREPPLSDNPVKMNRPVELGAEALKINQNFSQQIFNPQAAPVKIYGPPPFAEEKDIPADKVYRYRRFTIPPSLVWQPEGSPFAQSPLTLLVRTEIDAALPENQESFLAVRALNECMTKSEQSWTEQLKTHYGALVAQEAKNNHCKVAKWVSQAMLAGCDNIKIGLVTRVDPKQNDKHMLLSVQSSKVKELGIQIGIVYENMWGIARYFIDLILAQPDGQYIIVKDPVKTELKIYRTELDVAEEPEPQELPSKFTDTQQDPIS